MVGTSPASTKDNWVAAGDAVHEAWAVAGDEIRGAMGQVAAEQDEFSA